MPLTTELVGHLVRHWRRSRGLSQLALAERALVSTRHLSCVETGKSVPSREMVLLLASTLDVPLRERNRWLLAAGFAPVFRDEALAAPQMGELRRLLDLILDHHDPFPALVVDPRWSVLATNAGARRVIAAFVDDPQALAAIGNNAMHMLFHPGGFRPSIVNWNEVAGAVLGRLRSEGLGDSSGAGAQLLDSLAAYGPLPAPRELVVTAPRLLVPVHLRRGALELRFFTTLATLGTPVDVTAHELRIETYYPIDAATAAWARAAPT